MFVIPILRLESMTFGRLRSTYRSRNVCHRNNAVWKESICSAGHWHVRGNRIWKLQIAGSFWLQFQVEHVGRSVLPAL